MGNAWKSVASVLGAAVLVAVGLTSPASADEHGDSARGTIKIEETEFRDEGDTPNEVKVGCNFTIDFFGMDEGRVPVTFTLMPPSGDGVVARRTARVEQARGNELSGRLDVHLAGDLADVPPAQAEDFDYKVRVDAEVKESEGNDSITKSAMLFIVCNPRAVAGAPVGGVAAGGGGTASGTYTAEVASLLAGVALLSLAFGYRRTRRRA